MHRLLFTPQIQPEIQTLNYRLTILFWNE